MIDSFKNNQEDQKQKQIAQKNANAAFQFRKINEAQRSIQKNTTKNIEAQEKHSDRAQIARDMIDFNNEMSSMVQKCQYGKLQQKVDLGIAMRQNERKKQLGKQNQAQMDELHKAGPPMMQEIEYNQQRIENKTKTVNRLQGKDNYVLMLSQRRQQKKQKADDLKEYQAKFKEDLMARWSDQNQRELSERKRMIAIGQELKVTAAAKSPNGGNVKFIDKLDDQERRDYEKAKAIHD